MANPFSGLENIGASYMAGARLAQERQRRADEIVARQEEARVRQQYYQDIIAEREAARGDARKARLERAAGQFGQDIVLGPDGEIDFAASAKAAQGRQQTGRFAEAAGMLAGEGEAPGPLSPDILASPEYLRGRATTLGKRMAERRATQRALMSAGYVPTGEEAPPAFGLTPDLLREPRDTSQDVMVDGARFQPGPLARMRAMPKATTTKPTVTITSELPTGEKVKRQLTDEQYQAEVARTGGAGPKEPGIFDDLDAAQKQLQSLQDKGIEDFNLRRNDQGDLEVVEDTAFAIGRTPEQIQADLALERKRRAERRGIRTEMAAPSVPQGTNRVIDFRSIQGLPPLPGR
jgi:hypothetical protein